MRKVKKWNKCDECGKFISFSAFDSGKAKRRLVTPSSHFSREEYETLCGECVEKVRK